MRHIALSDETMDEMWRQKIIEDNELHRYRKERMAKDDEKINDFLKKYYPEQTYDVYQIKDGARIDALQNILLNKLITAYRIEYPKESKNKLKKIIKLDEQSSTVSDAKRLVKFVGAVAGTFASGAVIDSFSDVIGQSLSDKLFIVAAGVAALTYVADWYRLKKLDEEMYDPDTKKYLKVRRNGKSAERNYKDSRYSFDGDRHERKCCLYLISEIEKTDEFIDKIKRQKTIATVEKAQKRLGIKRGKKPGRKEMETEVLEDNALEEGVQVLSR